MLAAIFQMIKKIVHFLNNGKQAYVTYSSGFT
jgi:hypothetical protein